VFNVQLYDAANDKPKRSRRLATREGAKMMGGMVLEATEVLIDAADLEHGNQWTALDYQPKAAGPATFQTRVE
jgi:hypothetical protein